MKRILISALAVAAGLTCFAASAAAAPNWVDQYCSPTGDYCTGLIRSQGRMTSDLSTFSFTGMYQLCVNPPRAAKQCSMFRLRHVDHGILRGRVALSRHFDLRRRGRYSVSFHWSGYRIGHTLHFRKG